MLGILLGLMPLAIMFAGIIVLRWPVHKAGLLSVALTMTVSWVYSGTSPGVLAAGWLYGILIIHKYTLANLGSFILSFYMMSNGCFDVIGEALRNMRGGRVFKVFFLCFGIAILMLSAGAGIDWIAIVLSQLGIGSWAIPVLIDGSCDSFSQFAYLSTPITIPATVYGPTFGFTVTDIAALIGQFLWVVVPLFASGMLWVLKRDGTQVTARHAAFALVYAVFLAAVTNVFLNTVEIMGVGVLVGVVATATLFLANRLGFRSARLSQNQQGKTQTTIEETDRQRLIRAISPILVVSILASVVALPWLTTVLDRYTVNLPLIADQSIPVQLFQPAFWVFVSILITFGIFRPNSQNLKQTAGLLRKRLVPFVIASWICSGLVFTYNWSGMIIDASNRLVLPPDRVEYNLIHVLAMAASSAGQTLYIALVPFMAVFGCMLFGHELTSTLFFVRFHFISAKALGILRPLTLVAGHMVSNLGIVDVRKMMRSLAIIGAYGEEWKTMRFTLVLGLMITAAIVPVLLILA